MLYSAARRPKGLGWRYEAHRRGLDMCSSNLTTTFSASTGVEIASYHVCNHMQKGRQTMANKHLAIYLNDHLAGSTGALELLIDLAEAHSGTPIADGITQLHAEIHVERQELEHLIEQLHVTESVPRKVGAWLGEKVAQLKLQLDDKATGSMHLFEGLEAVTIGIQGKRALWRVLGVVSENAPELQGPDYNHLVQRSEDQYRRVEVMRLAAAKEAFEVAD